MENLSNNSRYNLNELREMSKGEPDFFHDMVLTFIKTTNESLVSLNNALKQNNLAEISHYAHKMVSPCNHLEINEISERLTKIEMLANSYSNIAEIEILINETNILLREITQLLLNELN